jgi:hypothetical protein
MRVVVAAALEANLQHLAMLQLTKTLEFKPIAYIKLDAIDRYERSYRL